MADTNCSIPPPPVQELIFPPYTTLIADGLYLSLRQYAAYAQHDFEELSRSEKRTLHKAAVVLTHTLGLHVGITGDPEHGRISAFALPVLTHVFHLDTLALKALKQSAGSVEP